MPWQVISGAGLSLVRLNINIELLMPELLNPNNCGLLIIKQAVLFMDRRFSLANLGEINSSLVLV